MNFLFMLLNIFIMIMIDFIFTAEPNLPLLGHVQLKNPKPKFLFKQFCVFLSFYHDYNQFWYSKIRMYLVEELTKTKLPKRLTPAGTAAETTKGGGSGRENTSRNSILPHFSCPFSV